MPTIKKFLKDRKVSQDLFNFLTYFLQEKIDHQLRFSYENSKAIKFFPIEFYLNLTNYNISNTFGIDYYEASKFTDYTNIFTSYDWLVIPIKEMESEYSILVINMIRRGITCFELSSIGLRSRDPNYANPERNPYMKNIDTFLHREWSLKMKSQDLGKFFKDFGKINGWIDFSFKMRYEESGICCILVMIHLLKRSNIDNIQITESEIGTLTKTLYELILRIGFNQNEDISYILEEIKYPF